MPISPSPGRGISTAGINKTQGWGSTDAAGGVIPGHAGDQGINHIQGLSEGGLDTSTAPYILPVAQTGMAATGVVLNWTSVPAAPAGSVKYRLVGGSGAYTTANEAAGTRANHTIPLTGLTAGKNYECLVTQPSWVVGGVPAEFTTRVHTTGGAMEDPEGFSGGDDGGLVYSGLDGAGAVATLPRVTPAEPTAEEVSGTGKGLEISAYTVDSEPTEIIAFWRTSAYADGEMSLVNTVTNRTITVQESGNKRLNHEAVASGLEPNTVYLVRVTSTDAAGDTATSDVQEVRTG